MTKLTALLMLAGFLQVSARSISQNVSMQVKHEPLAKVFASLKRQSGYQFFYNDALLKNARPVTVSFIDVPLKTALEQIFKTQPLSFSIVSGTVVVKEKPAPSILSDEVYAQKAEEVPPPLIDVKGRVVDEEGKPVAGASIQVKGDKSRGVSTNTDGYFELKGLDENAVLAVSGVNIESREVKVNGKTALGDVVVKVKVAEGEEVVLVNTGYQQLPKERATGSFFLMDNELLNRKVGMNILDRLEDMVPGISFIRGGVGRTDHELSIRGQSTIFANVRPLIIIDNFPYEGDLQNINPNDIENISILKDAAAASIWGARAGNGVIVITTKKGKLNQPLKVSFNANYTVGAQPDLYYHPRMSSADYIELEKLLFSQGYFSSSETSASKVALSPVVELLIAHRDNLIGPNEVEKKLSEYTNQDYRKDLLKYFYRHNTLQQLSASFSGGSNAHSYIISLGHDRNVSNQVGNESYRTTINAANRVLFDKNKFELSTSIYYTSLMDNRNAPGASISYPYERIADDQGNALAVTSDLRNSFKDYATSLGLIDWHYKPLEELSFADNKSQTKDARFLSGLSYKLTPTFKIELKYQYNNISISSKDNQSVNSYQVRNLINRYSSINTSGSVSRAIPLGGILDFSQMEVSTHNARAQAGYDKTWHRLHSLTAIVGGEVMSAKTVGNSGRYYGYQPEYATSQYVDYLTMYPYFNNTALSAVIPRVEQLTEKADRYVSYFGNLAYTVNRKYTVSASARYDMGNLFGVNTNQKGTPLYSAGVSWNLSDEPFYQIKAIPLAKLRLTYGYNGNVDKTLSAYTTARYAGQYAITGLPYSEIINPPNPDLRWERTKIINVALELGTVNRRITALVELFSKNGIDIIGETPVPSFTGISTFKGNTANTLVKGMEITLNTRQIDRVFKWHSTFLFSWVNEKITQYKTLFPNRTNTYLSYSANVPTVGRPLYAIYSYAWAGLDAATGDPQGYLKGNVSKDYLGIINASTPDNILYNGPARPTVFGALRNTFSWKGFSASFNISYRLNYFYRKPSIGYGNNYGLISQHGDYALRWRHPGDELHTYVPSIPAVVNSNRDHFYTYSDALVEKGDHIRLQDCRLDYTLGGKFLQSSVLNGARIYIYVNNLGILWKASDSDWDPDYVKSLNNSSTLTPPVRTFSFGLTLNF